MDGGAGVTLPVINALPGLPDLNALPVEKLRTPTDSFKCDHYNCVLAAGACVDRQLAVQKAHHRSAQYHPKFPECESGKCEQGAAVVARIPDYEPARTKWAVFNRRLPGSKRPPPSSRVVAVLPPEAL